MGNNNLRQIFPNCWLQSTGKVQPQMPWAITSHVLSHNMMHPVKLQCLIESSLWDVPPQNYIADCLLQDQGEYKRALVTINHPNNWRIDFCYFPVPSSSPHVWGQKCCQALERSSYPRVPHLSQSSWVCSAAFHPHNYLIQVPEHKNNHSACLSLVRERCIAGYCRYIVAIEADSILLFPYHLIAYIEDEHSLWSASKRKQLYPWWREMRGSCLFWHCLNCCRIYMHLGITIWLHSPQVASFILKGNIVALRQ